jgi:hypothetical protein
LFQVIGSKGSSDTVKDNIKSSTDMTGNQVDEQLDSQYMSLKCMQARAKCKTKENQNSYLEGSPNHNQPAIQAFSHLRQQFVASL